MEITFELDSPQDLLAKARREQTRLREAIDTQNRTQIADAGSTGSPISHPRQ